MLKQPLLFQLGNGGMDPGAGSVQVPGDRLLFGPYPAVLVGICGKRAVYGFGGNRKPGAAHHCSGNSSPAATLILGVHCYPLE